ncbi:M16 family metallopeptidase [Paracoccus sp. p4-l81]|uniref:M16 family metallopeptidase n=1 Tax=unclassified Paracoccus (in: a-proteobacteria) TaxID=2688777 RepID=UPI0035B8B344
MMMRGLILPVMLALAQPVLAETAAPGVSTFRLDNGLEAVVIEDHRAPVVVQMVWYRAGAADEARGKTGVAHFLEHLMFKGTEHLAPGELSKVVEANGGSDNAFTSQDYTAYFQRIASDRLDLVMGMEADRMRGLKLSEDDWATELQVIIEERAERTDSDPGALFGEQLRAAQYLNHPYGAPVIGWPDEMRALTREDALAWYQRFYAPNNAVLVVAGDVTPDQVKALAEKHYGPLAPTEGLAPRQRVAEPPQLAQRRLEMADPRVSQPILRRSYLADHRRPGDQRQAAALTVLAEVLGGSAQTSVLGRSLTLGDAPKALQVGAWYDGDALDYGSFDLALVPLPGADPDEAEAAMDAALAQFLKDGVDPAQLDRIRTQVRAAEIYKRDSAMAQAQEYGAALTTGLGVADVQAWPDALAAVTAEDVMAAARAVLDPAKSVNGWLLPAGGES